MPDAYSYRADPSVPPFPDDKPLIVFDGICVLCSWFAQVLLRRDTAQRFRIAAMQTPLAAALYRHYSIDPANPDSFLLIEDGVLHAKSGAIFRIFPYLGLPYSLVAAGRILPPAIADWLYDRVARNRYAMFGKRSACLLLGPADAGRFLA